MPAKRTPSYRRHKPSGRAVVTIDGRDFYLGTHGTKASRDEYDRLVGEWLTHGRQMPGGEKSLTINELILAYWQFAESYYRKNERPTSEIHGIRTAMRPLKKRYGHHQAAEFGPLALKAVRETFIKHDLCRKSVNDGVSRIKRMFKWATENELVPPSVYHGLQAVSGLKRGRTTAPEPDPVRPVPEDFVQAVLPCISGQVTAMIQLQELTGMRPGEVVIMRTLDLDTTGKLWVYVPSTHKTEHHGKRREVCVGPRGQVILRPFLRVNLKEFLFSPAEAEAARNAERRSHRASPMTPSQAERRPKRNRKRPPRDRYTVASYRRAIQRACGIAFGLDEKGRPKLKWHPNQLRHNFATRIRKLHGIEVARIMLGHESVSTSEIYAERDAGVAAKVAAQVG